MLSQRLIGPICILVALGVSGSGCGQTEQVVDSRSTRNPTVKTAKTGEVKKVDTNVANGENIDVVQSDSPTTAAPQEEQEKPKSRIDEAVKKLQEQEIVDQPRSGMVVKAREIHEALKPMIEKHWVRMHPGYEVWLDNKNKQVIVGGRVSLRDGLLEMFVCPRDTKEHESVVATTSNAEIVHTCLVAVGAAPGKPAQWDPDYVPATGCTCDIQVAWSEGEDRKQVRGQDMILDLSTGKTLEHEWVFCGSEVWIDPEDPGYRVYHANWGDMICVSNFATAMLDLTIESSAETGGLRFQANPDNIPALGTPVLVIIKPDLSTNPVKSDSNNSDSNKSDPEKEANSAGSETNAAGENSDNSDKTQETELKKETKKNEATEMPDRSDG